MLGLWWLVVYMHRYMVKLHGIGLWEDVVKLEFQGKF